MNSHNPTTPKAHRITPTDQPLSTDWIWHVQQEKWARYRDRFSEPVADLLAYGYSHYHPDQPIAPTSIPSPVSSQDSEGTGEDWAMNAAKQLLVPGVSDEHIAAVIRSHAPVTPRPNQPAQVAALAAAEGVIQLGVQYAVERKDRAQRVREGAAIILKHCFPAPSPGASGEVREAALRIAAAKALVEHINFISTDGLPDKKWDELAPEESSMMLEAADRILARITPFLSKPAAPMLPGGEDTP